MADALVARSLDVTLAAIRKLKLTLNHQVWCWFVDRVDFPTRGVTHGRLIDQRFLSSLP